MELDTFIKQLADAVEGLDASTLTGDTPLAALPQWDSLALLTTLAMVDSEYGVQVSGRALQECQTVGDLFRLVQKHLPPS
jgi:acyl carrier protein